jgi:hypothetical protein
VAAPTKLPSRGANLAFLVGLALLALTGVLIGVAVFSVIRMLAASPRDSIYVLSATPPPPPNAAAQGPVDAYTLHVAVVALDEASPDYSPAPGAGGEMRP